MSNTTKINQKEQKEIVQQDSINARTLPIYMCHMRLIFRKPSRVHYAK